MADLAGAPPGAHYAQEIARRLKAAMKDRGLSQQTLADAAGVGQRTVSRVLLGDVYCDVATLARLEQALGVNLYPADWANREL
ncbi:helix-turn-helix domain-containing protein [Nonomuraea sp. NPDC004297]